MTALIEIIRQVAYGQVPRETGIKMMALSIGIEESEANKIMGKVGISFKPVEENNQV